MSKQAAPFVARLKALEQTEQLRTLPLMLLTIYEREKS
jgi:hypothetical protein